jgi:hypothetical protein
MLDEYELFGLPIFKPHPFSSPPEEGRNDKASKYSFRRRPWLVRGRETTCERNNPRRLLQLTPGILAMRFARGETPGRAISISCRRPAVQILCFSCFGADASANGVYIACGEIWIGKGRERWDATRQLGYLASARTPQRTLFLSRVGVLTAHVTIT